MIDAHPASVDSGPSTLYVSYFGVTEPLVQTQVLPYLRALVASGYAVTLLTFEARQWSRADAAQMKAALDGDGIAWVHRRYHRRPSVPATAMDVAVGAITIALLARRRSIRILHARSHVAALMAVLAQPLTRARLLFDVRGLLGEEYVSGGNWPAGGLRYRALKRVERLLLRRADGFVVLTRRARRDFFGDLSNDRDASGRPIEVIPTCVPLPRFLEAAPARDEIRRELGVTRGTVFVTLGSAGTWYRTEDLAAFCALALRREPDAFVLCLTASPPEEIVVPFTLAGIERRRYLVRRVSPDDVPRFLAAGDVGLSFSEGGRARLAASPTKVAEYLASGLPVVQSADVGDLDEILEPARVGVMLRSYDDAAYEGALAAIDELRQDPDLRSRCISVARAEFDLEAVGAVRYRRIYSALL